MVKNAPVAVIRGGKDGHDILVVAPVVAAGFISKNVNFEGFLFVNLGFLIVKCEFLRFF
jgi:predicted transcriptional regulator